MKKLYVVVFIFTTSALFADMDPQLFFDTLNLRLSITSFASINTGDYSGELSIAEARGADANNDGYIFVVNQHFYRDTHQFTIINVNTRHVVAIFLSNNPDFPKFVKDNNWKEYGNVSSFSNLKEELLIDYESALQRLGIRTRRTSNSIQGNIR